MVKLVERWRDIPGYRGLYASSNIGNVKRNGKIRKLCHVGPEWERTGDGYLGVNLSMNGIVTSARVNRLIAITWLPNPEGKAEVNHLDGVKTNNAVNNLAWATALENKAHAIGLHHNVGVIKRALKRNRNNLRKVSIGGVVGYFHKWLNKGKVTKGLVELSSGKMKQIVANKVVFV